MKGSVRKRGEFWYYSFDAGKNKDGKRNRIEKKGTKSKRETESLLREEIEKYLKKSKLNLKTFYEISDEFLEYKKKSIKFSTYILYLSYIKKYKKYINENIFISELNINDFILKLKLNTSACNFNKLLKVFQSIYKYSLMNNYINYELYLKVEQLEKMKYTKGIEKEYFNINEIESYIDKIPSFYARSIFKLMFYTGMRVSEATALTWDCINFENKEITIDKILVHHKHGYMTKPKSNKSSRTIYIDKRTNNLLIEIKKYSEYIPEEKKKYRIFYLKKIDSELYQIVKEKTEKKLDFVFYNMYNSFFTGKALAQLARRHIQIAGLHLTSHCGRVSHATELVDNDVPLKIIQERLGHENISTTLNFYKKITKKDREKEKEILDKM